MKPEPSKFIRRCTVGLLSLFIDTLKKPDTDSILPVSYTLGGADEQVIKDLFLQSDKKCGEYKKVLGMVNSTPRGILQLIDATIIPEEMTGMWARINHQFEVDGDFDTEIKEGSSRGMIIPMSLKYKLKIRCNNDTERMDIFDSLIDEYYPFRKYFFSYGKFTKIPATLKFPEGVTQERIFNFTYDEPKKKLILEADLEVRTYKIKLDETTTYNKGNTITDQRTKVTVKDA
jgi:hypothetical protein